jgi:hypothetical protein
MWTEGAETGERLLSEVIPDAHQRRDFINQVKSELANPDYHSYYTW